MDILEILNFDKRVILFSARGSRSFITWDHSDTLQWYRPIVRTNTQDYENGEFDPDDWEQIGYKVLESHPGTFEKVREQVVSWYNNPSSGESA